ncbi:FAD-dependent monooxygenase [Blastococcus sp. TF02A-26]|uniref:FAD-dependent monooxygenase n=1 Tax=Blastococcus sp. TF02A-26 TaxID=2250577 RepID=UPI000DE8A05A|nr:FAD-dependent monooxygenase [Blastococcus sp. TF02A-26]RBY87359.1 salicylate hydroxylase [Blastococcus sp. TF02A-26]
MGEQVVGVVGGGVGGVVAALALRQLGREVVVFEQAGRLGRVGADINLTPNAVVALDGLGVGEALRRTAARPSHRISRTWDTGEETSRLEMGTVAEERYGSPQLTIHRADLLDALVPALPDGVLHLGRTLSALREDGDRTVLEFTDGGSATVDVLVGADGIHSVVREALFGPEQPEFTGVVAYRAVVPAARLEGIPNLGAFTKWWGPDAATQIVTFPLNRGEDVFVFATRPQESWREESWTAPGDVDELRRAYAGFHAEARALLDACDSVLKSALYVRDPLPRWSVGTRTLLGDACHPMMPFMAQGAGMAIEDAVVLARALAAAEPGRDTAALQAYEQARRGRTADVQIGSRGNDWLRTAGNADWVYGYDAWTVPLT